MLTCPSHELIRMSPFVRNFPLRPTVATGARVTTAFARLLDDRSGFHIAELRATTLALVATMKAEGFPPESVLVALKQAIGRAGWWPTLIPAVGPDDGPFMRECGTYSRVFEWFLEGYFGLRQSG